jgi:hypothetical protein
MTHNSWKNIFVGIFSLITVLGVWGSIKGFLFIVVWEQKKGEKLEPSSSHPRRLFIPKTKERLAKLARTISLSSLRRIPFNSLGKLLLSVLKRCRLFLASLESHENVIKVATDIATMKKWRRKRREHEDFIMSSQPPSLKPSPNPSTVLAQALSFVVFAKRNWWGEESGTSEHDLWM